MFDRASKLKLNFYGVIRDAEKTSTFRSHEQTDYDLSHVFLDYNTFRINIEK